MALKREIAFPKKQRGHLVIDPYRFAVAASFDFGLAAGGYNSGGSLIFSAEQYTYSSDTSADSGSTMQHQGVRCGSTSSGTKGYVAGTNAGASVDVVAYGTLTWVTGTALARATAAETFGVGESTRGIFAGGSPNTGIPVTTTDKYTYSGDTTAAGTALNVARNNGGGAANATVGICGGGYNTTPAVIATTSKYTFSGDTTAAGTAFATARSGVTGTGNTTTGIFGGGVDTAGTLVGTSTEKYTYSGDTRVAGTALGTAKYFGGSSALGNTTKGIFAGGDDNNLPTNYSTSDKYTYSGDTRAAGGTLSAAISKTAGVSGTPGGF